VWRHDDIRAQHEQICEGQLRVRAQASWAASRIGRWAGRTRPEPAGAGSAGGPPAGSSAGEVTQLRYRWHCRWRCWASTPRMSKTAKPLRPIWWGVRACHHSPQPLCCGGIPGLETAHSVADTDSCTRSSDDITFFTFWLLQLCALGFLFVMFGL